ncbi:MAG TPA: hypothetical protein H9746_02520 [Candidatus Butyricicoccus avistercoris]|uniref:Uncharacterized protein n=1 Tax=Candidatus Butyricicoccus avistercoris TaxID=2838518 RepID=A0A9D1TI90_9FIRM|nr:hypothetical protein [Candidatus Butyricicoccus avistercoris]
MSNKLMDTQELNDIRRMLGEEPNEDNLSNIPTVQKKTNTDSFDLNDILAEVSGVVDQTKKGTANASTSQRVKTRMSGGTANIPRITGTIQPGTGRISSGTGRIPKVNGRVGSDSGRVSQSTGRYSQASQRIPRIPGVDPMEVEMNMRKMADEQARHLKELATEAAEEQERERRMSRKERRKLEKERRMENERMLDKEDEIEIRNPREALKYCRRRAKNLARRSLLVLILTVIAMYITVASGMGLPLPSMLKYAEHTFLTVMTMMMLQFFAMFIGLDIVGNGIYNLFKGRPDRGTLVVISLVASLLHGMTIILFKNNAWMPYCAISMVLLFAQMQEEKAFMAGRYRAYKAAALGDRPTGIYAHADAKDRARRAVKYRMRSVDNFLREMERTDTVQVFERIYTPIAILASIAFSVMAAIAAKDWVRFFWAFSAIMSISAPLGILCSFGTSYKNISRKLLSEGAAIAGAKHAQRLCKTRQAIMRDSDFYPAGSIVIDEIKNYGNYTTEKLLAYASAVTANNNLEIGRVLAEALREQFGRPVKANNIVYYESGGMSADIGTDNVMVGTAAFLSKLGISQPTEYTVSNSVYVVINSQIAGEIVMSYHPTAQTYGAVHIMTRVKKYPVISAQDFNISPAMVESMFEVKKGEIGSIDAQRIDEVNNIKYVQNDKVSALLSKDGAMPFAIVLQSAERLLTSLRANLFIGTVAGIAGMLLMFYLTYKGAAEAVEPKNVLIYLLLWYLPTFAVNTSTKISY